MVANRRVGVDTNNNGELDDDEITRTEAVCNGVNGTDGTDGENGKMGRCRGANSFKTTMRALPSNVRAATHLPLQWTRRRRRTR